MLPTVTDIRNALNAAGVQGVQGYCDKLEPNWRTPAVYRDLFSEAYAALMFARSGFEVQMGESPDLVLKHDGQSLGAEVKRFHRKQQDDIDDQRMQEELTEYGNTVPTEGKEAWFQVEEVALKKSSQLRTGIPNILVIESSSPNCIEETEILSAVKLIDNRIARGIVGDIGRLNGIVFMSIEYSISRQRNVYFFEVSHADVPLSGELRLALEAITEWTTG
ncbi:MAG: hypothetical protein FVQ80_15755 [Planctomycetes bacterium]|nr:hypothetical protein [Planctomycetota bacterium]